MRTRFACLAILLPGILSWAGAEAVNSAPRRIEVVLEKKEGNSFRVMDAAHVFDRGDLIRFRFRSATSGFLYATNEASSGTSERLFPSESDHQSNEIQAAKDYLIPSSDSGWFRIEGPSGYETVYFLVSPVDLSKSIHGTSNPARPSSPAPAANSNFASATPRCDDALFQARGECLDTNAGPKMVQRGESLPEELSQIPGVTSRDLVIVNKPKATSVSAPQSVDGPAVFYFRIAHH